MKWLPETSPKLARVTADLARDAAERFPDIANNWVVLARSLQVLGETQKAEQCLRAALDRLPTQTELRLALVRVLESRGAFEAAVEQAAIVLIEDPGNAAAKVARFEMAMATKDFQTAEQLAGDVRDIAPSNFRLFELESRRRGPLLLVERCDAILSGNPGHTDARYHKAIALAKLGRTDEARAIMSVSAHVDVRDLPSPHGYADDFLAILTREIERNPTLQPDPRGKATSDGLQTGRLRQPDAPAVDALLEQIKDAVEAYAARVARAPSAMIGAPPPAAMLRSWAVICGENGKQKSHRHPGGWLSGVFYVAAPRPPGENRYRGPLLLGALDPADHGVEPPWGVREIEPVPGRLVLFPSSLPHATEPTGIDGERICVAFDIIPQGNA